LRAPPRPDRFKIGQAITKLAGLLANHAKKPP